MFWKPILRPFAWMLVPPVLLVTLAAEISAAKAPVIKTIAGQTFPGYNGDGKRLAKTQLYWPQDVAIDPSGAVYIDDWNNHRIRKATSLTGTVSTVFGQSKLGYDPVNHPTSITIDPQTVVLKTGATQQLGAIVVDDIGQTMQNVQLAWATSDPNTASVSPTGIVTGIRRGNATITATAGAARGEVVARVK